MILRWFTKAKTLRIFIGVDGFIALLFGLVSLLAPGRVFASLVDLAGAGEGSLLFSSFCTISILYLFTGLFFLYLAKGAQELSALVPGLLLAYHGAFLYKNLSEINAAWLTGNPWPDIVIHLAFIGLYAPHILFASRRAQPPVSANKAQDQG